MPPLLFGPFGLVVLPLLAGAGAIYLLLPRPKAFPAVQGALLGALALALAGWLVVGFNVLTPESFLFYVFSATAVGFGALLVTQRNPARAALSFALVVLSTCGLFLLLAAPFLMAATIIIYAGAIIVTFLFVLMLAQQEGPSDADARSREPLLATIIGFVLLGALLYVLQLQWNYETTGEGQVLTDMLRNTAAARAGVSEEAPRDKDDYRKAVEQPLIDALRDTDAAMNAKPPPPDRELRELLRRWDALKQFDRRLAEVTDQLPQSKVLAPDEAKAGLDRLEIALLQLKQKHGWPQPDPDRAGNLSPYSGPQPDLPADQVRADPAAGGAPYLPAENPSYLGRSLFTDYLLPVELGGFLLLAATIGAIAIAQRQSGPIAPRLAGDSRSESPTIATPERT